MKQEIESKVYELLIDVRNWDQNLLFLPMFSMEETDALWNRTKPRALVEENAQFQGMRQMIQMALLSFGVEGSIPARVRSGEILEHLDFFAEEKTCIIPQNFKDCPQGVLYQIIQELNIEKLIIEHAELLPALFSFDFQLCADQIKSLTFVNMKSDFQLVTSVFKSSSVEELVFEHVEGKILPEDLSAMHGLKKIKLSNCSLTAQPVFDFQYQNLESLTIESAELNEFDFQSVPNRNLTKLALIDCKLTDVSGLTKLTNLREINVSHQKIKTIDLDNLIHLECLVARNNSLTAFPQFGSSATTLRELDVSQNGLTDFSCDAHLPVIEEIRLSSNLIQQMPSDCSFLANIRHLDLSDNFVEEFPTELVKLKHLRRLNLEDNRIEEIRLDSPEVDAISTFVFLRGNRLKNSDKRMLMKNRIYMRTL